MRKTLLSIIISIILIGGAHAQKADSLLNYQSPTEAINHKFVAENQMKTDLLNMLADFSVYMDKNFVNDKKTNTQRDSVGGFRCRETMTGTEDGIRTTADLGMVCAFLWKYGQANNTALPDGITYDRLYEMAKKSLTFTYSTHKANGLFRCRDNRNWGSYNNSYQFESSLWAMSMAYQAFFLWDSLSTAQRNCIQKVLDTECDYITMMPIKTNMKLDTRAEENGWDVCVLAANIGLFPDSKKADKYFKQLRTLAINTLSHPDDAKCTTVIDPEIDSLQVRQLYKGNNLFEDYTLQNHNYFHPGYQNVAIQELGEATLALQMFQQKLHGTVKYRTNTLTHNCKAVHDEVLNYLALPDGELAMPNGNDWSQYLFDQITTYSTMACILRDPDALMLENMAYKNIKARQKTTQDGSWLLNSDIGQRRMGVQAHRVMMTYLMHEAADTKNMKPSSWDDFLRRHYKAKAFTSQNVVRAASPDRFVIFSISGKKDFSGIFVPNDPGHSKTVIPFYNMNSTGNFLGHYRIESTPSNGINSIAPRIQTDSNSFVLNCEYSTNSYYLTRRHALYATPGNAVISIDMTRTNNGNRTITEERCGQMTLSMDPFTNVRRILHHEGGCDTVTGQSSWKRASGWLNIDNRIGVINLSPEKTMFLDRIRLSSSIYIRELYTSYSDKRRQVPSTTIAGRNSQVYLSNVSAQETRLLAEKTLSLDTLMTDGWMGVMAEDRRGKYLLIANFFGKTNSGELKGYQLGKGEYFPAIENSEVRIADGKANATFQLEPNRSIAMRAGFQLKGNNIKIRSIKPTLIVVEALEDTSVDIMYSNPKNEKYIKAKPLKMRKYTAIPIEWNGKKIIY